MIALSLPVFCFDMRKTGNIIKIGNSRGVIIPASILKTLSLKEKDEVRLMIKDNALMVKKIEPVTGPFTGVFAELAPWKDAWGERDSSEIEDELRAGGGTREIPEP
jgi:antitoxin component of MazEF toxin-antitoxin module